MKKTLRAGIIATGSELLWDGIPETHSLFLADRLGELGFEVVHKSVVGDDERLMADALRRAASRTQLVIITGGLGPTEDDVTRKVISRVTRRRLVLQEKLLEQIKKRYADYKQPMPAGNARQALMPARARVVPNPTGTAPGLMLHWENCTLVALPGVGSEMRTMFMKTVRPYLEHRFPSRPVVESRVLRTFGLSESLVNERLAGFLIGHPQVRIGMTAKTSGVDVRIRVTGRTRQDVHGLLGEIYPEISDRLSDITYSAKGEDMERVVGRLLAGKGRRVAVAESCTGGLIGHRLTNIPGSSEYVDRVTVCYSDQSKTDLLNVPAELIRKNGAVSAPVAGAMARGIRQGAKTDFGLAVTGIAGPGGGSPEKPVGLVFFGWDDGRETWTGFKQFSGDREAIKARAAQFALNLLRERLLQSD
ncbi:MAG TPA: competence/damage-inducible protein A [Nitrospiria bacterium]|nr:competence/damage-inducible protein A [Nitrospiria bacterium]